MSSIPSLRRWHAAVIALVLAYCITGVFGRFPWKADEPYSFGIVWEMLDGSGLIVPRVAGEPFVEKPPLVYWLGAASARLLPSLPAHESSRMAVLLLVALAMLALYRCARRLHAEALGWSCAVRAADADEAPLDARSYALLATLLVPGTLGFAEHIHKLTADVGQLAGAALGLWSLVAASLAGDRRQAVVAGLGLGSGAGIAFLSKGPFVPLLLATSVLLCHALPGWRNRRFALAGAVALAAALPWLVAWPVALHRASPELFQEWLVLHNVDRFVGAARLGGNVSLANRALALLLAAFLPLAMLARVVLHTVRARASAWRRVRDAPGHVAVHLFVATSLAVLAASAAMRDNYLLPLLPALILAGLPAVLLPVRGRWWRAVDALVGVLGLGIVLLWFALRLTAGAALPPVARQALATLLPLPFTLRTGSVALLAGIGVAIAWRIAVAQGPRRSACIAWSAGAAMVWSVAALLLLPWIDAARSYAHVFAPLAAELRAAPCVATVNLGESEAAMVHYVAGVRPVRAHLGHSGSGNPRQPNPAAQRCDRLLVLTNQRSGPIEPCRTRWQLAWSGARPGDARERLALYRLASGPSRSEASSGAPQRSSPFAQAGAAACLSPAS